MIKRGCHQSKEPAHLEARGHSFLGCGGHRGATVIASAETPRVVRVRGFEHQTKIYRHHSTGRRRFSKRHLTRPTPGARWPEIRLPSSLYTSLLVTPFLTEQKPLLPSCTWPAEDQRNFSGQSRRGTLVPSPYKLFNLAGRGQ